MRSYESVITPFCRDHGSQELEELTVDLVQAFLESITNGRKPQTRKIRFAHLTSFFNFVHNNLSPDFQNPCNSPMMRKLFRPKITTNWSIIEKDAVDEIILRSVKIRNRLILELMARGGMRIGEVLKLTTSDLQDRKLTLREPTSSFFLTIDLQAMALSLIHQIDTNTESGIRLVLRFEVSAPYHPGGHYFRNRRVQRLVESDFNKFTRADGKIGTKHQSLGAEVV